jgi:lipopolysaccharide/colanic/teichoic acid biosynthesis glycosyltransferase
VSQRLLDLLVAIPASLLAGPAVALACLAIRLESPGHPIYRQRRIGRHGRPFEIYKLRTMVRGAEFTGAGLAVQEGDDRITRVGAFLRRTSLDELPNLWNVLRGEMSIVGPRPALSYELEHYAPEHFDRFDVRPGLTGLWQVSGRNAIGFVGMLELDAEYARTTSLRLDAMILLRTPLAVLRANSA